MTTTYLFIGLIVVIYALLHNVVRGLDKRFDSLERKIEEINISLHEVQEKLNSIGDEVAEADYDECDHTLDYNTWRERQRGAYPGEHSPQEKA